MNLYGVLLFVHVVGVIVWLGAGIAFFVLTERAARSRDPRRIRTLVDAGDGLGPAYFPVAAVVVLATGLWLVFEGGWGFDHVFVIGGLAGVVLSAVIGAVVFGPASRRLGHDLGGGTTVGPEAARQLARIRIAGRVDMVVLLLVVFVMTVKPGS